jgi:phenylacetate-coenzyme A ligase PaaK-like adenylate-forming protein
MFEYGSSEASGFITRSTNECTNPFNTMHENSSKFFIEIVDSEIILTTLLLPHALPLIRYRTGDAARFIDAPCPCGNPERRIEILGRIDGDFIRMNTQLLWAWCTNSALC